MKTACVGFSATSFGSLVSFPKPSGDVEFRRASELSLETNEVTEKVDSLTSFSCLGYSISVEALQLFLGSKKNLAEIRVALKGGAADKTIIFVRTTHPKSTDTIWG